MRVLNSYSARFAKQSAVWTLSARPLKSDKRTCFWKVSGMLLTV